MLKKILSFALPVVLVAGALALTNPVEARPTHPQVLYQTPTPLPDGRIMYKVKADETCLSISLLTGVSMDNLRTLNKLDEACTLIEGKELLLATVAPPTATPEGAQPSPTPLLPTPTPFKGTGDICIALFADINGNAKREETEDPIAGGAVSIARRNASGTLTGITDSSGDDLCFSGLEEGDYAISMAAPDGYNPTSVTNYNLKLVAGDRPVVNFGAQVSSLAMEPGVDEPESNPSPLLALVGGLLLLAGAGLGIYIRFLRRG